MYNILLVTWEHQKRITITLFFIDALPTGFDRVHFKLIISWRTFKMIFRNVALYMSCKLYYYFYMTFLLSKRVQLPNDLLKPDLAHNRIKSVKNKQPLILITLCIHLLHFWLTANILVIGNFWTSTGTYLSRDIISYASQCASCIKFNYSSLNWCCDNKKFQTVTK